MPMTFRDTPTATFTFVDDDNNEARVTVGLHGDISAGPSLPTMQKAVVELAAALQAVSDASLVGATLNYSAVDVAAAAAGEASEVERKGYFVTRTSDGYLAGVEVPSIAQAVLESDRVSIDLTNEDVADLVEWLTEAQDMTLFSLFGNVSVANTKGVDVVDVLEAYQVHRGSRKQRSRRG